jgi:protoporphyrinogen oxidase
MKKVVILGAGIAGLTAGYQLKKINKNQLGPDTEVIVFEKESEVGGLSRTVNVNGNRFDFGGHRFWTKKDEINQFLKDLLKDELLDVPRSSKIRFNNKFVDYPLKPNAVFAMNPPQMMLTGIDFLYGRIMFHFKKDYDTSNFENCIIKQFGFQLYKYFFKGYTEKIWGIPCTQLSSDWAGQRIKGLSIRSILKNMFFPGKDVATLTKTFYYPKLGIARIAEKLAEPLEIKHEEIKKIEFKDNKILSINGEAADKFISTIPITELASMLNPPEDVKKAIQSLRYREITFLFMTFKGETLTPESWIYFPDTDIPFGRIHEPKNWSRHMCRKGESSVVLEFFCDKDDDIWNTDDDSLFNKGKEGLKKVGLLKDQEITGYKVVRIEKCYPMYKMGYQEHVRVIKDFLSRFDNLICIGRNGTFKYLNIDHVIEQGIKCAENIDGAKHDLDEVGSEKEYQEEKHGTKED